MGLIPGLADLGGVGGLGGTPKPPWGAPGSAASSHIPSGSLRVRDEQANPALIPDYQPREARPQAGCGVAIGAGGPGEEPPFPPSRILGFRPRLPRLLGASWQGWGQLLCPGFRGWEAPRRWKCLLHLHPLRAGVGALLSLPTPAPSTSHPGKLRHGASPAPAAGCTVHPSHGKTPGAGSWWLLRPPRSPGRTRRHGRDGLSTATGWLPLPRRGREREKQDKRGTGHRSRGSGTQVLPAAPSLSRSSCRWGPACGGASVSPVSSGASPALFVWREEEEEEAGAGLGSSGHRS